MEFYELADGLKVPKVGFGTGGLKGSSGAAAVANAIRAGYRLIDTAYNYENEGAIGQAIRQADVPRSELLIESKLAGKYYAKAEALDAIQESLYRAGLDYFDIYLLHWPNPIKDMYVEAWDALIEAKKRGLVRAIGVANFVPAFLDKIEEETGERAVINQIPLNPDIPQFETRAYDDAHHILTEDWSPLGGPRSHFFNREVLVEIAEKYNRTVGQLVLRWEIQHGTLPIPKSTNVDRQKSNLELFDFTISAEDMASIAATADEEARKLYPDPTVYEQF